MNRPLILDILQSPDDLELLSYYSGLTKTFPENLTELSPLQHAFREYLGDAKDLNQSPYLHVAYTEGEHSFSAIAEDRRPMQSSLSFWHGMTAELLALAHVDRALFQSKAFAEYQRRSHAWDKEKHQERDREVHLGSHADTAFTERITKMSELHQRQVREEEVYSEALPVFEAPSPEVQRGSADLEPVPSLLAHILRLLPVGALLDFFRK